MSQKRIVRLAWTLVVVVAGVALVQLLVWVVNLSNRPNLFELSNALGWALAIPLVFAVLAALIIDRQPGNRVGWLMMIVAITTVNPASIFVEYLVTPPEALSPGLWLYLWLEGWSWILIIFPIFLIPLHFPSGHLPSSRWNWVIWLAGGMWMFFIFLIAFSDVIGPSTVPDADWTYPNPIGFVPLDVVNGPILILWGIGLLTMISASVLSLFMRFRQAHFSERQQIKWLLFAGAFFVVVYGLTYFLTNPEAEPLDNGWINFLFVLSILTFPVAIAIAILRYRLYDIDIIIRRTLQYGMLSVLLALVYFGSVVLLQTLFDRFTGQQSPIVIVISTLLIAALFTPLRRRVQELIDRRFFRQKYDSQEVLADFAKQARDQTDLDNLTRELGRVVAETMQPHIMSIWLREDLR